ncbi:MAG: hypothetical protein KME05_24780 [Gloeocapsa sp. UFS-A4-WI-NPMV-4B04]|jgi:hypothetical protein|nr:hypothetical protein [Gloeocapsa sp. UFS-A4-WI-NPMV-4B04]
MSYYLPYARTLQADFNYLIGTCQSLHDEVDPGSQVQGIVLVGDDGACIDAQMECGSLRKALLDNTHPIIKPWLFKYRVYLIYQQLDDDTTLYYQDLLDTLDRLGIPLTSGRYHH